MVEKRALLIGAVLLVVSAFTWWLQQEAASPEVTPTSSAHRPMFTVNNFTVTTMGLDGRPGRRLIAKAMRHYSHDESTELDLPHLAIFPTRGPPWLIRSDRGWVSADGELLLFQGRVFIDRAAMEDVPEFHLITRDLGVQPKLEYAETVQPVEATSERHQVHAVGMKVWFGEPVRIKLLADVRGRYEINY